MPMHTLHTRQSNLKGVFSRNEFINKKTFSILFVGNFFFQAEALERVAVCEPLEYWLNNRTQWHTYLDQEARHIGSYNLGKDVTV